MTRLRKTIDILFLDGFSAAPRLMWVALVVAVVSSLSNSLFAVGFKVFVDAVVDRNTGEIVLGVVLSGALITVVWYASVLDADMRLSLLDHMSLFLATRLAQRVNKVASIEHFERPEYLRELDLLDQGHDLLRGAPRQTLTALSSIIRGTVIIVLLSSVHPVMALLPLVGLVPMWAEARAVRIRERADARVVEQRRLADEFFELTATTASSKELRVYGLTGELIRRHDRLGSEITRTKSGAALRGSLVAATGWAVFVAAFVAGIVLVIRSSVAGQTSAGKVVLIIVLAQQVRGLVGQIASNVQVLLTTIRTASRAIWLDDYVAALPDHPRGLEPPERLTDGIRLQDVTFRYPGTDTDILRNLDLHLPAGSSVALVGENGAGKTSIIKLLTGMYQPTTGAIVVEGTDLRDLSLSRWRERIAATFQDHMAFEFIAAETVGVGDLPHLEDHDAVLRALDRANATDVIDSLDNGLATTLGRSFPEGRELSGGQWQKLALGRGMMRDQPLLVVLDEPTASIDAETEHALFERYAAAARRTRETTGAITIIVSHRFSTVRAADLVVVVDDGAVAEIGTHEELITTRGSYAELFELQARGYA